MSVALLTDSGETFPPLMISTVVRAMWDEEFALMTIRIVARALLNAGPFQHLDSLIASLTGFVQSSDDFGEPVAVDSGDWAALESLGELRWVCGPLG
jgi:hypothetical protein